MSSNQVLPGQCLRIAPGLVWQPVPLHPAAHLETCSIWEVTLKAWQALHSRRNIQSPLGMEVGASMIGHPPSQPNGAFHLQHPLIFPQIHLITQLLAIAPHQLHLGSLPGYSLPTVATATRLSISGLLLIELGLGAASQSFPPTQDTLHPTRPSRAAMQIRLLQNAQILHPYRYKFKSCRWAHILYWLAVKCGLINVKVCAMLSVWCADSLKMQWKRVEASLDNCQNCPTAIE